MKNLIMIQYDLNKENDSTGYAAIKKFIEDNYPDYQKPLKSLYVVKTLHTSQQVWDKIAKSGLKDSNDRRLINKLTTDHTGWLSKTFWDWAKDM